MKYIGKFAGFALLSFSISVHAGLWGTTTHSRANCFNNESITGMRVIHMIGEW